MDHAELQARIDELGDEQAVAALAYVLDVEEVSAARRAELERDSRELPTLLADVTAAGDLPTPAGPGDAGPVGEGEVARATLRFLVQVDATRPDVQRAVDLPTAVLHKDPLLIGVIGGLAFLALSRFGFKLSKDEQGRRSYTIEYRAVPDEAMGDLLQLLTRFLPGP
jgi:hypothetical protein